MLTHLTVRNFKRFDDVRIELGESVVFIGPNNSGKTTALQALALWDLGLRRWAEKRRNQKAPEQRPGVAINRRDLLSVPVPVASLLWRDLRVRAGRAGGTGNANVRVEVVLDGLVRDDRWSCGLEFDYANEESFYCRSLRLDDGSRMPVPEPAYDVRMAYLPPMSGLAANEVRLDRGAVDVRLGEGRTAEVLRNLCYLVQNRSDDADAWPRLVGQCGNLFGIELQVPEYIAERGEIRMDYREHGVRFDLSALGRGAQQTLLLLAHLALNPGSVLLLDEPDAHLEVLRQRQILEVLWAEAERSGSQVIAASHSEVVLGEAAEKATVVAFIGRPHRLGGSTQQAAKALASIGFDQYALAEQTGWVLYLEGSTDLSVLRAFAEKLGHPARVLLERPFVHFIGNQPQRARDHFHGLREAKPDLVGYLVVDRLGRPYSDPHLPGHSWTRREVECYLCTREALVAWAQAAGAAAEGELAGALWARSMEAEIVRIEDALAVLDRSPWNPDLKVTDEFLDRLFRRFAAAVGQTTPLTKTHYHRLVAHLAVEAIDAEVTEVLDSIVAVAASAQRHDGS